MGNADLAGNHHPPPSSAPSLSVNVDDGATFQQEEVQIIGKTDAGAAVLVGGKTVAVGSWASSKPQSTCSTAIICWMWWPGSVGQCHQITTPPAVWLLTRRVGIGSRGPQFAQSVGLFCARADFPADIADSGLCGPTRRWRRCCLPGAACSAPACPKRPFLRIGIDLSKPARTTVEVKDGRGNVIARFIASPPSWVVAKFILERLRRFWSCGRPRRLRHMLPPAPPAAR
ncbi:MAG: hypothetical protein U0401_23820 [Anaerolineae bacterium]